MMKMHRRNLFKLTLLALIFALIPLTAHAAKGGNGGGGGKPGDGGDGGDGGTPVLSENPALLYTTWADLREGEDIVLSNPDGSAKKRIKHGLWARDAKFVPGENAFVYAFGEVEGANPFHLMKLTYDFDTATGEPIVVSDQPLETFNVDYANLNFISVSPSGDWVAYRSMRVDPDHLFRVIRSDGSMSSANLFTLFDEGPTPNQTPWITDVEWLSDTPGDTRVAIHYGVHTESGSLDYSEIAVFNVDPTFPPSNPPVPLLTFRMPRDENQEPESLLSIQRIQEPDVEGVVFTMRVATGETEKVQGLERNIYESFVHRLVFDYGSPETMGIEILEPIVLGNTPRISPDSQFALTKDGVPQDRRNSVQGIVRTSLDPNIPDADREVIIENSGFSFDPDWNPNWAPPAL